MIPAPARYLLRFDDLCPTLSRQRWMQFQRLIEEFSLQPILAVTPDNRDPALAKSAPDPSFWGNMRRLESAGATIGLHGLHHLCMSRGPSLLGLHRLSEFAGVPPATQRSWIRDGQTILRSHSLNPRIFVAPRHGFDLHTLDALRAEGMPLLSDGFARAPFVLRGVTSIPQQLWAPVAMPRGVFTICIHPNTAVDDGVAQLRAFLSVHRSQFTSVARVLAEFPPPSLTIGEWIYAEGALRRLKFSRTARRMLRGLRLLSSSRLYSASH